MARSRPLTRQNVPSACAANRPLATGCACDETFLAPAITRGRLERPTYTH